MRVTHVRAHTRTHACYIYIIYIIKKKIYKRKKKRKKKRKEKRKYIKEKKRKYIKEKKEIYNGNPLCGGFP